MNGRIGAVIFFVALFFIHTPYEIALVPGIEPARQILQPLLTVFLMFCLIVLNTEIKNFFSDNLILWAVIVWMLILYGFTWGHDNIYYLYGYKYDFFITPLSMVLLIAVYAKVNIRRLLGYLFAYYLVMNTLNNASALFFHNRGMWGADFAERNKNIILVGNFNNSVEMCIPSVLTGIVYSLAYDRKWTAVNFINLAYSIVAALVFSCDSQLIVGIACTVCYILCLIYAKKPGIEKGLKWLNTKVFLVLDLLVFDAVVILGNFGWMEAVGMDPRVHGRRELWDVVLERIIDHPINGNGYSGWILALINGNEKYFAHEHSIYLHFAHIGGAIGVVILIFMLFVSIRNIQKLHSFDIRLIFTFIFGFFFLILTIEMYRRYFIFLMFALFCYIPKYLEKDKMIYAGN